METEAPRHLTIFVVDSVQIKSVQGWIHNNGDGGPAPLVPAAGVMNRPATAVLLEIGRGLLKSASPLDWTTRAAQVEGGDYCNPIRDGPGLRFGGEG